MVSSLRLEVLLEDVVGGTLLAPVSDDTRGAFDHLSSGAWKYFNNFKYYTTPSKYLGTHPDFSL